MAKAKAKAKANNKLKIFLYAFITVMTILALFLAWTLYVLTDFTNGGPKTVDSTQDYYSIPPSPPFLPEERSKPGSLTPNTAFMHRI